MTSWSIVLRWHDSGSFLKMSIVFVLHFLRHFEVKMYKERWVNNRTNATKGRERSNVASKFKIFRRFWPLAIHGFVKNVWEYYPWRIFGVALAKMLLADPSVMRHSHNMIKINFGILALPYSALERISNVSSSRKPHMDTMWQNSRLRSEIFMV